jgi:hypothetical protein
VRIPAPSLLTLAIAAGAFNTGGAAVKDFGISVCLTHIDVPETTFS